MKTNSLHFIPADKPEFFAKTSMLPANIFIFDLEDAVPIRKKELARQNILNFYLEGQNKNGKKYFLRINEINSEFFERDIELVNNVPLEGIVIPKFNFGSQMLAFLDKLDSKLKIILIFESIKDLMILSFFENKNILGAGLGLEDMLSSLTFFPTFDSDFLIQLKTNFVLKCKANGWECFDTVSMKFADETELSNECNFSRRLGFDGRFSIHPKQIDIINSVYSISEEEINWAKNIIEAVGENYNGGYQKVGKLIVSPPKYKKAKLILGI
ncbi:HpcH/HpaI aldolase/citrate lyase family protein [Flexithrix dorotheae]|uniref:HpcH/HpaI aldolase/citrate lyase family protein n=1 Tax=Flexithrix dorotheae TaxID=70993 RepID=UPI000382C3ED|nr:CoA ester lyase [Flexithrix dorotheae]